MREKRCAKATMSTLPSKFSKEWVRRMADTASGPIDSCRLLPIIMYTSAVICVGGKMSALHQHGQITVVVYRRRGEARTQEE
jgi:hypothetical protein